MATNLALDDKLIEDAVKAGRHKTKKEAVTAALTAYVRSHKQKRIKDLFGMIEYDEKYDYKKQRSAR